MDGRMEEALELLIELMKRERGYGDQAARRGLLAVFELLGGSGDLVNRYRARMSNLLY
jgi:putative thioredoxin